jgi:N-acetylmuramoyl-L-alanine amidase
MLRLSRPALALVLVCVAGCSSAPLAPAQPTLAQATAEPAAVATAMPAAAPTDVPTAAPLAQPTVSTVAPQAQPTAQPADTSAPTDAAAIDGAAQPSVQDQPPQQEQAQQSSPNQTDAQAAPSSHDQPPAQDLTPVAVDASQLANCDPSAPPPAPLPAPGSNQAQASGVFRSFRVPLPPAPLYDPPGQKRIGLQAGHWLTNQVPPELRGLGGGAVGGGRQEWQVNLDVAQRTAALLEDAGFQVDVLPATVPEHYQANVFVALHADGDTNGQTRGFKVARPGFSSMPAIDDRLVDALEQAYGTDTELPRDDEHISLRMRYYYAFNSRRYCHAVMPGVPQAIIEMAYLTNAIDRQFLIGDPDKLAQGLADGIRAFLATTP